jgi:perosamine synthetase
VIPRRKAYTYPGELTELDERCRSPGRENPETIAQWEKAIADYVGTPYAAVVTSGRRGMTLILKHLGIAPGDEVIVPAYTLKDLIPLIQDLGAKVVPADIDRETLNVRPETIEARIGPKTRAILALHAFGAPCAIEAIAGIARRRGIALIEDCAHSLGATVRGRQTGAFGHAGFFSFETTKPVNTFGGGMVVSADKALIDSIHRNTAGDVPDLAPLKQKIGATRTEAMMFSTGLGFPMLYLLASPTWKEPVSRLYRKFQHAPPSGVKYATIQAELGLKKLASLADRIAERKAKAALLRSLLSPEIRTQRIEDGGESTWYFLVAVLPCQAVRARKKMLTRGVDAGIEDEIADNIAALLGYKDCPVIDEVFRRAIVLPLYEGISEEAIRKTARVLNKVVA